MTSIPLLTFVVEKLIDEQHILQILIGVAGDSGLGKTSLLNALLGVKVLPESNQEASTATVCQISWNFDQRRGRDFRAEVVFRTKQDS